MSGYREAIVEATRCDSKDAAVIEEVMRVESPTLDHLDRRQFRALARRAELTLAQLRQDDPEVAAWYEEQAR